MRVEVTASVRRLAGTDGVCGSVPPGSISIVARFPRSVVGAMSLHVTTVPPAGVGSMKRCTQNVSPAGARYSATFVWPEPTVCAVARSQSLPTPHTHAPGREVVSEAAGAPVVALPVPVAGTEVVSAPVKVAIVIEPWEEPVSRVAVIFWLVSTADAAAVQISLVPYCTLVRRRNVHVTPPPATPEKVCAPEAVGPSEVTNATSSSFAADVVNAGDTTVLAAVD